MEKYKSKLIILLILMCVVAALQSYRVINDVYSIAFNVKYGNTYGNVILLNALSLILDLVILSVSVFGIVILTKIIKDKQSLESSRSSSEDGQTDVDKN